MSEVDKLVGRSYVFDDGSKIDIIQVKRRDDGMWVTYTISRSRSLPRKLVMVEKEFLENFGHLFGVRNDII